MTGRTWTLEIGHLKPLTLNGARRNPYTHARDVKRFRHLGGWLAKEQQIPALSRVEIELHYVPRDRRRRDPMNLVPTRKAIEDGIVDAGVIPDDTPQYSPPIVPVIDEPSGELGRLYVIVREVRPDDVVWFQRTGHCGGCGQPGDFCLCTDRSPCGCRELHPMGSGRAADPAAVFAVADADQDSLW